MQYRIPAVHHAAFKRRMKTIEKKAAALEFPFECRFVEETFDESKKDGQKIRYKVYVYDVTGEAPHIKGWEFVAKCEDVGGANLIKVNPLIDTPPTIPATFRDRVVCDHCGTKRGRKKTFILKNTESGELKQVGTTCFKDFFATASREPESCAAILEYLAFEDGDDWLEDLGTVWAKGLITFPITDVLATTAAVIESEGWLSKSRAALDETPTADIVSTIMIKRRKVQINEKHEEIASAALAWLSEQESKSDYIYNCQVLASVGHVGIKHFGYACSIVASYQRDLEKAAEKAVEKAVEKASEYVGTVKKREVFDVRLVFVKYLSSLYGTTVMHKFITEKGDILVWFGSSELNLEVKGGLAKIKATVKKHEMYNGVRQTIVQRVALC